MTVARRGATRPGAARHGRAALRLWPVLLLAACGTHGSGDGPFYSGPYDGTDPSARHGRAVAPKRFYPPPGPAGDPWGPYIREAAGRFSLPEQWLRAVMHQESGGREQAVSSVGAMGLMQVMPATYQSLRKRHGLGEDPYDPHNNVLAGAAYIREMYDRFGSPGFLAAYNAGPERLQNYLSGSSGLPDETVNYLASITPHLGDAVPLSGPLAMYASARPSRFAAAAPSVASLASGCDVNAAYDPDHPCAPLERAATAPVQVAALEPLPSPFQPAPYPAAPLPSGTAGGGCDPDAAFDPDHPCRAAATPEPPSPAPTPGYAQAPAYGRPQSPQPHYAQSQYAQPQYGQPQYAQPQYGQPQYAQPQYAQPQHDQYAQGTPSALYRTSPTPVAPPAEAPRTFASPAPAFQPRAYADAAGGGFAGGGAAGEAGAWAIQVGAFANPGLARAVAEGARAQAPEQLRAAELALPPTDPFGGKVLYRARLVHLSARAASDACAHLNQRQLPCVVVRPASS